MAEGSATVALAMADELGTRIRYATPVTHVKVGGRGCAVTTANGERFESEAVVCAIPVGPLRARRDRGRVRRAPRLARPPAPRARGEGGVRIRELVLGGAGPERRRLLETGVLGGTWVQREGIISALVPPERLARLPRHLAARRSSSEMVEEMVQAFGERARAARRLLPPLGRGPLDRGLHHLLAAGRRDGRRAPCTAPTSRPSTCAARTSGSAGTWRARCAPVAAPPAPPSAPALELRQRAGRTSDCSSARSALFAPPGCRVTCCSEHVSCQAAGCQGTNSGRELRSGAIRMDWQRPA